MIFGVGADIVNMSRLDKSLSFNDPFVLKTFTSGEIEEAAREPDPAKYFISRFACKEAVFKCMKTGGNSIRLNEIEIRKSDPGYPTVALLGNLKKYAEERGIVSIEVSISYETGYVVVYAIAQTDGELIMKPISASKMDDVSERANRRQSSSKQNIPEEE